MHRCMAARGQTGDWLGRCRWVPPTGQPRAPRAPVELWSSFRPRPSLCSPVACACQMAALLVTSARTLSAATVLSCVQVRASRQPLRQ